LDKPRKALTFNKFNVTKRQIEGQFKNQLESAKMLKCMIQDFKNEAFLSKSNKTIIFFDEKSKAFEELENALEREITLERKFESENESLKAQIKVTHNKIMEIKTNKMNIHLKVLGKKLRVTPKDLYHKAMMISKEKIKKVKSLQPGLKGSKSFKRSKAIYLN
jgi:hypothetical protein